MISANRATARKSGANFGPKLPDLSELRAQYPRRGKHVTVREGEPLNQPVDGQPMRLDARFMGGAVSTHLVSVEVDR
jgi:hypothetical protein